MTLPDFQQTYVELRPALLGYLYRLTTNREDAEDLAQETYLKAQRGLKSFSGRSSFKTWLFAIATNLARDHQRVRKRFFEDSQECCRTRTQASPEKVAVMRERVAAGDPARYEFREHIDFCFSCMAKSLPIEQQLAVILKEIYQFRVADIVEILDSSEGKVKHSLAGGRRTLTDIYDRRCALINKEGACEQCSEVAGFVNPKAEAHHRQMTAQGSGAERLLDLRTALVRGIDPLNASATPLHEYMMGLIEETARIQQSEGSSVL